MRENDSFGDQFSVARKRRNPKRIKTSECHKKIKIPVVLDKLKNQTCKM